MKRTPGYVRRRQADPQEAFVEILTKLTQEQNRTRKRLDTPLGSALRKIPHQRRDEIVFVLLIPPARIISIFEIVSRIVGPKVGEYPLRKTDRIDQLTSAELIYFQKYLATEQGHEVCVALRELPGIPLNILQEIVQCCGNTSV